MSSDGVQRFDLSVGSHPEDLEKNNPLRAFAEDRKLQNADQMPTDEKYIKIVNLGGVEWIVRSSGTNPSEVIAYKKDGPEQQFIILSRPESHVGSNAFLLDAKAAIMDGQNLLFIVDQIDVMYANSKFYPNYNRVGVFNAGNLLNATPLEILISDGKDGYTTTETLDMPKCFPDFVTQIEIGNTSPEIILDA